MIAVLMLIVNVLLLAAIALIAVLSMIVHFLVVRALTVRLLMVRLLLMVRVLMARLLMVILLLVRALMLRLLMLRLLILRLRIAIVLIFRLSMLRALADDLVTVGSHIACAVAGILVVIRLENIALLVVPFGVAVMTFVVFGQVGFLKGVNFRTVLGDVLGATLYNPFCCRLGITRALQSQQLPSLVTMSQTYLARPDNSRQHSETKSASSELVSGNALVRTQELIRFKILKYLREYAMPNLLIVLVELQRQVMN